MNERHNKNKAFTLIELLTVVAIIAMLISIFGIGMRKVKIIQKNLQQKAAFHGGEVSLELYSKDFGDYPDSALISDGSTVVTGAQRLAEALFGRDDQGFHPRTKWHPSLDTNAAAPHPGAAIYTDLTLKDRKPPYFERNRVGFYTINDLWGGTGFGSSNVYTSAGASSGTEMAPVFTDVFEQNRVTLPSGETEKVGMPILYYKADNTKRFRVDPKNQPINNPPYPQYSQWVYNFMDNRPILQLPWLRDPADPKESGDIPPHFPDEDGDGDNHAQVFYEMLTQSERDTNNDGIADYFNPHNKSTFIFISAGYDGIYGTKDDLTNFDD